MNVQDERLRTACSALSLNAIAEQYPALAQEAADSDARLPEPTMASMAAKYVPTAYRGRRSIASTEAMPAGDEAMLEAPFLAVARRLTDVASKGRIPSVSRMPARF